MFGLAKYTHVSIRCQDRVASSRVKYNVQRQMKFTDKVTKAHYARNYPDEVTKVGFGTCGFDLCVAMLQVDEYVAGLTLTL